MEEQLDLDLGIEEGLTLEDLEGDDCLFRLFCQAVDSNESEKL